MKKISSCFAILFCMMGLTQSCKKENTTLVSQKNIAVVSEGQMNVRIASDETYQLDLGILTPEENAIINRQATYYEISAISRDYSGRVTYKYKPTSKFVGTDEVELKSSKGSGGSCSTSNTKVTTIKFTISN